MFSSNPREGRKVPTKAHVTGEPSGKPKLGERGLHSEGEQCSCICVSSTERVSQLFGGDLIGLPEVTFAMHMES